MNEDKPERRERPGYMRENRWERDYEASKSAARDILNNELETVRARTERLRSMRAPAVFELPAGDSMMARDANEIGVEATDATSESAPVVEPSPQLTETEPHPVRSPGVAVPDEIKRQILGEVAVGGVSIAEIARRYGVSSQLIYYWRKRSLTALEEPTSGKKAADDVTSVENVEPNPPPSEATYKTRRVKITCRGGRVLKIDPRIEPDVLRALIRVVEAS